MSDRGNIIPFTPKQSQSQDQAEPEVLVEMADTKAKLEVFERMIEEGMVMVTLDARPVGVQVPSQFRDTHQLNLNFSHKFFLQDFEYDNRGVRASLSFGGVGSVCDIPWPAVWMLRSHETGEIAIAPTSIPDALRAEMSADPTGTFMRLSDEGEPEALSTPPKEVTGPLLQTAAISDTPSTTPDTDTADMAAAPDEPAEPFTLRLIKS